MLADWTVVPDGQDCFLASSIVYMQVVTGSSGLAFFLSICRPEQEQKEKQVRVYMSYVSCC